MKTPRLLAGIPALALAGCFIAPLASPAAALPAGFKISGNRSSRIFEISVGATVTLNSLVLLDGSAGSGEGGAILVDSGGTLTNNGTSFSGNAANNGGGLYYFNDSFAPNYPRRYHLLHKQ